MWKSPDYSIPNKTLYASKTFAKHTAKPRIREGAGRRAGGVVVLEWDLNTSLTVHFYTTLYLVYLIVYHLLFWWYVACTSRSSMHACSWVVDQNKLWQESSFFLLSFFFFLLQIFPLRHRGRGVALTVCVNRLTSGLVALAFPLVEKGITAGGIFFVFMIFSVATVWFYKVTDARNCKKKKKEKGTCEKALIILLSSCVVNVKALTDSYMAY